MFAVFTKLNELSKDAKIVKSMRVIACCEGVPERVFGKLTSKILTLQKEPDVDLEAENPTTAAFYVYTKLVKLGRQLTSQVSFLLSEDAEGTSGSTFLISFPRCR